MPPGSRLGLHWKEYWNGLDVIFEFLALFIIVVIMIVVDEFLVSSNRSWTAESKFSKSTDSDHIHRSNGRVSLSSTSSIRFAVDHRYNEIGSCTCQRRIVRWRYTIRAFQWLVAACRLPRIAIVWLSNFASSRSSTSIWNASGMPVLGKWFMYFNKRQLLTYI